MTVRENVHRIIDTLPEKRLADVVDYLVVVGQRNFLRYPLGGAFRPRELPCDISPL